MSNPQSYATLKPAFFLHLDVEEPKPIFKNESGSLTLVPINGGYTKTIDPSYPFDTEVITGWDNLTTRSADGNQTITLDCSVYLKTKSNGSGVKFYYNGTIVPSEKQVDVITGKSSKHEPLEGYVTATPTVELDSNAVEEQWINHKKLIARGRFVRNEKGVLGVEYWVYVLD
ncbi:hypothetical protein WICMUC_005262 [Wickerhamomyces mucosus]|uniref:Uncharacterized protein n=1 Tax=Wickerhamomyces mucosus TaxID=1378264 RepID=A0A9P8P9G6_9ASCO|nr:hypothetical protein WICMUC_005262 [Wickerhamomyces mucosus]